LETHPQRLCELLHQLSEKNCSQNKCSYKFVHGIVKGIQVYLQNPEQITGVMYRPISQLQSSTSETQSEKPKETSPKEQSKDENETVEIIPCDGIVICMGPWSSQAYSWFPLCRNLQFVTGSKANSIVVKPHGISASQMPSNAYFVNHSNANSQSVHFEVYPRADGTIYCCGSSTSIRLPDDPFDVKFDSTSTRNLRQHMDELSREHLGIGASELLTEQACYLPLSHDDKPLIGKITGTSNAYVGAGHTCWGILNSLVTGLLLSELIVDGEFKTVSAKCMKSFDPSRK